MEKKRPRIITREQLLAEAQKFNLMSDVFMRVALDDIPACQYVLRILTGIPDLEVKEIRSQYEVSKLASHDARLDIFAEDSQGKLYDIEIQRSDTIDHARRTRFYGAMIDSSYLEKGAQYSELPEVHIIYLSEKDLWKQGRTSYPVKKHFENTSVPYDDGIHILYVNAAVDDGTEIARMMRYFVHTDPHDASHGDLSKRIHFLKCEEGGNTTMCEVSETIRRWGHEEGREEGREAQKLETARRMLSLGGFSCEQIAQVVDLPIETVKRLAEQK